MSQNNKDFDMKKAAEECSELATILIQQINKPHKDYSKKIIEELGDVLFRVQNLTYWYNPVQIKERIEYKKRKK